MTRPKDPKRSFSVFRSAAEEADMKTQAQNWDNEGGHMSCTSGRVVRTREGNLPYKVILSREGGDTSECGFSTIQEAEAFIRRNTPLPAARSTLFDRDAENA